jgi:uncharacterized membrane protein
MPSQISGFLIIIFALSGLILSLYIYRTKKSGNQLICPIHDSCDEVIRSDYSIIFGISVEVFGMLYYCALTLLYLSAFFTTLPFYPLIVLGGAALSSAGFLMSLYLFWLQAVKIKKWCSLCATSAILTTLIFVLSFLGFWPIIFNF